MDKINSCTRHINLRNLLFSILYLSIAALNFLDSFYITCENPIQLINSDTLPRETNENNTFHQKQKIILTNNFQCEHILITYCTEIFGSLINFVAASLYFTTNLHSLLIFSNSKQQQKKLKSCPFPSRYLSTDDRISSHAYFEFSSLLAVVAGISGCLMIMTTTGLRTYKVFISDTSKSTAFVSNSNATQWYVDSTMERLKHTSRILLIFGLFVINIYGLCLSTGYPCKWNKLQPNEQLVEKNSFTDSLVNTRKDILFCSHLTRLISLLSSILIISGGLTILGSVLESVQLSYLFSNLSTPVRLKVREIFCFFNGSSNIITGLLSIITLQCCSIPLESVFRRDHSVSKLNNLSSTKHSLQCPTHLIALISCYISIPVQISCFLITKLDTFVLKVNKSNHQLNIKIENSLKLFHQGFALNCFSGLISLPLLFLLLACILIDLYVRNKLTFLSNITSTNTLQIDNHNYDSRKCLENDKLQYFSPNKDNNNSNINNNQNCQTRVSCTHYLHLPLQRNLRPFSENDTVKLRNCTNGGLNQKLLLLSPSSPLCSYPEDRYCTRSSVMPNFDNNENRCMPYRTSCIQPSNSLNPAYLELDSIRQDNSTVKAIKSNEINLNPNYLSQVVYRCSPDTPHLIYHSFNEQQQFAHRYPTEACEYMSCDLQQQQQPLVTLIHPEVNKEIHNFSNLTTSELLKLFTDTTGEDFITSV
ncbi:unnamed protein product [Trichobilharzia szidati]|nr:unnamed protein product [Trichobilharzia szidati]